MKYLAFKADGVFRGRKQHIYLYRDYLKPARWWGTSVTFCMTDKWTWATVTHPPLSKLLKVCICIQKTVFLRGNIISCSYATSKKCPNYLHTLLGTATARYDCSTRTTHFDSSATNVSSYPS